MKKAFTLIEIILAIFIFSIIIIYMYNIIAVAKKSTTSYENMYKNDEQKQIVKKLFYNDIFNQTDPYTNTTIKEKDNFATYYLRTNNSLHNIVSPYVVYKIIGKDLYRFESPRAFDFPLKEEQQKNIYFDKIASNVDYFLIYTFKNSKLISYSLNKSKTVFEVALPYNKKVIVVSSKNN